MQCFLYIATYECLAFYLQLMSTKSPPRLHIIIGYVESVTKATTSKPKPRHRSTPMLNWHTCECMLSIININNGIKEFANGCQNCNTNQIFIVDGYVKMRESLHN